MGLVVAKVIDLAVNRLIIKFQIYRIIDSYLTDIQLFNTKGNRFGKGITKMSKSMCVNMHTNQHFSEHTCLVVT